MLNADEALKLSSVVRFLKTTGNRQLDQLFALETRVLRDVTSYGPAFAFFDDSAGANAFATPEPLLGNDAGTVAFGLTLLGSEQADQGPFWDAAAVFIMAHEWGHIAEFHEQALGPTPQMELCSDYVAGWYLGWKHTLGSRFDASGAARSVFSKGNFNFNSPDFHGTPQQRLGAALMGYESAFQGAGSFAQAFSRGRRVFGL